MHRPKIAVKMTTADFNDAFMLRAGVGTTGFKGGDGGHGGRTVLVLENLGGGGDIEFKVIEQGRKLLMLLKGDAELTNIKDASQWWLERLQAATGAAEPMIENIQETSITVE